MSQPNDVLFYSDVDLVDGGYGCADCLEGTVRPGFHQVHKGWFIVLKTASGLPWQVIVEERCGAASKDSVIIASSSLDRAQTERHRYIEALPPLLREVHNDLVWRDRGPHPRVGHSELRKSVTELVREYANQHRLALLLRCFDSPSDVREAILAEAVKAGITNRVDLISKIKYEVDPVDLLLLAGYDETTVAEYFWMSHRQVSQRIARFLERLPKLYATAGPEDEVDRKPHEGCIFLIKERFRDESTTSWTQTFLSSKLARQFYFNLQSLAIARNQVLEPGVGVREVDRNALEQLTAVAEG